MLVDGRIRIRTNNERILILEAQKHTDPTDPDTDPQHWNMKTEQQDRKIALTMQTGDSASSGFSEACDAMTVSAQT